MKKLIFIVLAVMLVASGLGGFAYAASSSHQPMTGQKLIGTSPFGTHWYSLNEHLTMYANFTFTNPDCVGEITIERISIISGNGTVMYEGLLLQQRYEGVEIVESTPVTWPMEPHQIWGIDLRNYMPDPDDPNHEWKNIEEAQDQLLAGYTVEILWKRSHKRNLPLIGRVDTIKRTVEFAEVLESAFRTQMVNMKQP